MKICYVERKFKPEALTVIAQANKIIEEYNKQGYELTLRQLYYQFVSRDLLTNDQRSYKNLGSVINDARLAGLVSWEAIIDRTRNLQQNAHWDSPSQIVMSCAQQFQLDKWENQEHRVEVWIEKDALIGVIERACNALDVPYFSCRGYTSQSEMWAAAMRLQKFADEQGQTPVIIHLGDHDPSGIDMSRDIADRLELFTGGYLQVKRIALNMKQVEKYEPPPNPAKITDSRAKNYIQTFGDESWELDALDPKVLDKLVRDTVLTFRDEDKWAEMYEQEQEHKRKLLVAARKMG